jgi:hypothetical protein
MYYSSQQPQWQLPKTRPYGPSVVIHILATYLPKPVYNSFMDKYARQRASIPALRQIGAWATVWLGISGLFITLWVWLARYDIAANGWLYGLGFRFVSSLFLQVLLSFITSIWVITALSWLRVLHAHKISYKTAFTDLFLTIRK